MLRSNLSHFSTARSLTQGGLNLGNNKPMGWHLHQRYEKRRSLCGKAQPANPGGTEGGADTFSHF